MRFRVEPMRIEHIPAVGTIERRCFTQPWPSNAYRKEIQSNRMAHYFVVRRVDEQSPNGVESGTLAPVTAVAASSASPTSISGDDGLLGRLARLFRGPTEDEPSTAIEAQLPRIAGYAGLWLMTDEAHVTTIAVDPEYQGHGIGELLLLGLLDRAKQIGARKLTLEVRVTNHVAQALYRKYTFKEMGRRPRYYSDNGEDALVMWTDPIDSETFQRALRANREILARKLEEHE